MNRCIPGAALVAVIGFTAPAADDPPTEAEIAKLVAQLGSPDYDTREAATKRLKKIPAAMPALREVANESDDPEARSRAAAVLKVLTVAAGREQFPRQVGYAKARQVDRLVESLVMWREAVGDDHRLLVREFARDVLARVKKEFGPDVPPVTVTGLYDEVDVPPRKYPLTIGGHVALPAWGDVVVEFLPHLCGGPGVTVSRDGGATENGHGGPVCLMNGSFRCAPIGHGIRGTGLSLVVCNGDFTVAERVHIEGDIIICTGDVTLNHRVDKSLIIAGGKITVDPDYIREGTRLYPEEKRIKNLVSFYDAAAEGLHVEVTEKRVTVVRVDAGKPFAALRPGDRILRVNDQPVSDLRGLNRYLCRAEVGASGAATIAVARGNTVIEAVAKLTK